MSSYSLSSDLGSSSSPVRSNVRTGRPIAFAIFYFMFASIITWWFIRASPLYTSSQQRLLSCGIAGAKWGIQILAALLLLKEKRWTFIKDIGLTCFIGSLILLPYAILSSAFGINGKDFFQASLLVSVAAMILMYAITVRHSRLGKSWWLGWLLCLVIAIGLQLTFVFHVL